MSHYDLAVVGGGPAGYAAALRGAGLGARVVLIEQDRVGGVCLHAGCIPTKTLLRSAAFFAEARQAAGLGVEVAGVRLDWAEVLARKDRVVSHLSGGLVDLLARKGVELVQGRACYRSDGTLQVQTDSGTLSVRAHRTILAFGSRPGSLPGIVPDGERILDTSAILGLRRLPASLLVVGGGAVGCEYASLFAAFGVKTFLVELLPRLLPAEDPEMSVALEEALRARGVAIFTGRRIQALRVDSRGVSAYFENREEVSAEICLLAVGREPNITPDLNLDAAGVQFNDRQGIKVDRHLQTTRPGVYAAGDVIPSPRLAHVAYYEGWLAAENALRGNRLQTDYRAVPRCVFTNPEFAAVGCTAPDRLPGGARTVRLPLGVVGRNWADDAPDGFVKLAWDPDCGEILGLSVLGKGAADMAGAIAALMQAEATVEELAQAFIPHPTAMEALKEVALLALGQPFHS